MLLPEQGTQTFPVPTQAASAERVFIPVASAAAARDIVSVKVRFRLSVRMGALRYGQQKVLVSPGVSSRVDPQFAGRAALDRGQRNFRGVAP